MSVTGTGKFAGPLETFRTLLKSLPAVQEWMGVDGMPDAAGEVARRIYINQFDEPAGAPGTPAQVLAAKAARPLIIIGTDTFEAESNDQSPYWPAEAAVWMDFQELARNENGTQTSSNKVATSDALMHLMNAVGEIMEALEAGISAGGTLHGMGWGLTEQAGRVQDDAVPGSAIDLCGMVITFRRQDMK